MCTYLAYVQHVMDVQLASIIWQVRKPQGPNFFVMELESKAGYLIWQYLCECVFAEPTHFAKQYLIP